MSHKRSLFILVFAVAAVFPLCAYGAGYNTTADFSTLANPNGSWSYNYGGVPIAASRTDSELTGWDPTGNWDGAMAQVIDASGWFDAQNGDFVMHSPTYSYHELVWTAPSDGTVDIYGYIWDAYHYPGRDSIWEISVNGDVKASRDTIYQTHRTDTAAIVGNNLLPSMSLSGLAVSTGDRVVIQTDKVGTNFGHLLGVDITVNHTPIPEPSAPVLAALGILCVAFCRRRRKL